MTIITRSFKKIDLVPHANFNSAEESFFLKNLGIDLDLTLNLISFADKASISDERFDHIKSFLSFSSFAINFKDTLAKIHTNFKHFSLHEVKVDHMPLGNLGRISGTLEINSLTKLTDIESYISNATFQLSDELGQTIKIQLYRDGSFKCNTEWGEELFLKNFMNVYKDIISGGRNN